MSNLNEFAQAIKNTHLGDIIEECVVTVQDKVATIMAMDMSSSVFVCTSAEFDHDDCIFGISDLTLLSKYIGGIKNQEVVVTLKKEALWFKPEKDAKVRYLLADPGLVPTYDEDWEGHDPIEAELAEVDGYQEVPLTKDVVDKFMKVMGPLAPNSIFINTDKRGNVIIHGGKETEHQFDVKIGKVEGLDQLSLKLYGKNIAAVLSEIDFGREPVLYLAPGNAVIIKQQQTGWMISPVDTDAT